MSEAAEPVAAPAPAAPPDFSEMSSVEAFRSSRDQIGAEPVPVEAPAPVAESPEQEAEGVKADTEISDAARTLRQNRSDVRKAKIQAEISELVKERNQLQAELAQKRQPQTPVAPAPSTSGTFKTFDQWLADNPERDWSAYVTEAARHEAQTILAAERAAAEKQTLHQTYSQRVQSFAAEHPDFDEALSAADVPMPEGVIEAIQQHPHGPAIAYHLATHPEVAVSFARLPQATAFMRLGEIAATVSRPVESAPKPKPITSAPAPINPIGGSASAAVVRDPKDIHSVTEWRKRRADFL